MKASDIPDDRIYEILAGVVVEPDPTLLPIFRKREGESRSGFVSDFTDAMPEIPYKVVRAKLAQMVKNGRLRGCTCGCRGDFRFPWEEFGEEGLKKDRKRWRERMKEEMERPKKDRRVGY